MDTKQVLSREQIDHLHSLGFHIKNTCFYFYHGEEDSLEVADAYYDDFNFEQFGDIATLSFLDVLQLIPDHIETEHADISDLEIIPLFLDSKQKSKGLVLRFVNNSIKQVTYQVKDSCWIDAAYQMLCWCLENHYIK